MLRKHGRERSVRGGQYTDIAPTDSDKPSFAIWWSSRRGEENLKTTITDTRQRNKKQPGEARPKVLLNDTDDPEDPKKQLRLVIARPSRNVPWGYNTLLAALAAKRW